MLKAYAFIVLGLVSIAGHAQSSTSLAAPQTTTGEGNSKMKIEEALENKKFREDGRITDIELKAQAGSLSRYSLKFDLTYAGPPVDNLSDPEMPNPDNRPRPNRTSLGGFMGLRYRLSSDSAVNLSTGARWFTPFQQIAGQERNQGPGDKTYEIANPQISYDRTYAVKGVQLRSSVNAVYVTSDYYLDRGQTGSVGVGQALKYTVPNTRIILGSSLSSDLYFFDRGYAKGDGRLSLYGFSFVPSVEYKLTDNLNLRGSVGWSFANLRMEGNQWDWQCQEPTARAGIGWAITRDVYFAPYLNFFTMDPAIRTTSASFTTTFSIF